MTITNTKNSTTDLKKIKVLVLAVIGLLIWLMPMLAILIGVIWVTINSLLMSDKGIASPKTVLSTTINQAAIGFTHTSGSGLVALEEIRGYNRITEEKMRASGLKVPTWDETKEHMAKIDKKYEEEAQRSRERLLRELEELKEEFKLL